MILTVTEMLNHTSRCEEWTDERTIRFMISSPNIEDGTKSLRNAIDSIGVEDVTYSDIFFCIINHITDRDVLFKYCIDTLEYINTQKIISGVSIKLEFLKNYIEVPKSESELNSFKENIVDDIRTQLKSKGGIDTEIRILKLITKLLDSYFIVNRDMVLDTLQAIRIIISAYPEFDYQFHVNRLDEFLNK